MTKRSALIFYVLMAVLFAGGGALIVKAGSHLEASRPTAAMALSSIPSPATHPFQANSRTFFLFFLQFAAVFATAKGFGFLFKKIGQPSVIGEMVAGIALGPSLFGALSPDLFQFLFPSDSLHLLKFFSQAGVLVFMFMVGMELNLKSLKQKVHAAVVVSHAGIIAPYFLGMLLSLLLYKTYAPATVGFLPFSLFIGISMSITAFPVLARILEERNLTCTPLGTMALTCAAADDVTAWAILAAVVAVAQSQSAWIFLKIAGLTLAFTFFMLYAVRPFLKRFWGNSKTLTPLHWSVTAAIAAAAAWATSAIGIHALFGVFLTGAICPDMPAMKNQFKANLGKISMLLLPLFFVFTGLRTHIALISGTGMICALIILVAVLGKLGGTTIAGCYAKMQWAEALSLGVLMNTRGLMELIVLNIGYDLGILSQTMFAMLVIMALVTTFMAAPILIILDFFFVRPSCC